MSLTLRTDLIISGGFGYVAACSDSTNFYTCTTTSDFRYYDWSKLAQQNTTLSLASFNNSPADMCLVTSASALACSTNANQTCILGVTTNDARNLTVPACYARRGQQVCSDHTTGIAFITKATNSSLTRVNCLTQVVSSITPAALSGAQASCIVNKTGSGGAIMGTNNGKIIEIDSAGAQVSTFTLPTTPNVSTPSLSVSGLSYYNDNLLVLTDRGILYHYTFSSSTLKYTGVLPSLTSATGTGGVLCESASGYTLHGVGNAAGAAHVPELYFNNSAVSFQDGFWSETFYSVYAVGVAPDPVNQAWIIYNTSSGKMLRIFYTPETKIVTEPTRSKDPADISVRVIRYRDNGPGKSFVEIDTSASAGSFSVNCTKGQNYIELAIKSAGPNRWDIREFTS